jgi:hypothetical protein
MTNTTRIVAVASTGKGKHKLPYFIPIEDAKAIAKACTKHWQITGSLSCKDMLTIMRANGISAHYSKMCALRKFMIDTNRIILSHKQPRPGVRGGIILEVRNIPE